MNKAKCCCAECRLVYNKLRKQEWYQQQQIKKVKTKICLSCGIEFNTSRKDKKYCTKTCAIKVDKEYHKTYDKEWRDNNPSYAKDHQKEWLDNNPNYKKEYNLKNKDKHNARNKLRRQQDIQYKIKNLLRHRINVAIKAQSGIKNFRLNELLGCTGKEVADYLETLFQEGMTWQNHGFGEDKWHIDHIKPCDAFDLTDPEQQKECFNYKNLQPLWQPDNLSKGAKW